MSINQSVSMVWWSDLRNFRFSLFSSAVRPRIGSTTFFRRRREFMNATTFIVVARAPIMFVQPSHSRASAARDFKFAGFPSCAIFMANDAVKRAFCSFRGFHHRRHIRRSTRTGSMHSSSLASGSSPDTFTNDSSSKLAPLADT